MFVLLNEGIKILVFWEVLGWNKKRYFGWSICINYK